MAGQYFDEETSLNYNVGRYYSPYLSEFLSCDPQCFRQEASNYSYANNDPYNRVDVNGNLSEWTNKALAISAGIVVGTALSVAAVAITAAVIGATPVLALSGVAIMASSPVIMSLISAATLGALSGGAGLATESIVSDILRHESICLPCAIKNAAKGAAIGAVLGPVTRLLGLVLSSVSRNMLPIAAKTRVSALGHYPEYVKLADKLKAKKFTIPTKIWDKMTPNQQWDANVKFLDRMIKRGDKIKLATPLNKVKPGSFYEKELKYITSKGYKISPDGQKLIKIKNKI